jgi:hypothetical protein
MQAIDYLHCKAISYLAFLKLIYTYVHTITELN